MKENRKRDYTLLLDTFERGEQKEVDEELFWEVVEMAQTDGSLKVGPRLEAMIEGKKEAPVGFGEDLDAKERMKAWETVEALRGLKARGLEASLRMVAMKAVKYLERQMVGVEEVQQ